MKIKMGSLDLSHLPLFRSLAPAIKATQQKAQKSKKEQKKMRKHTPDRLTLFNNFPGFNVNRCSCHHPTRAASKINKTA